MLITLRKDEIPDDLIGYFEPVRDGDKSDVWNISTQGFSGAHFATWPEALVEPMVKAGTSEWGCCPECGVQWERITEKDGRRKMHGVNKVADDMHSHEPMRANNTRHGTNSVFSTGSVNTYKTIGWRLPCEHYGHRVPCTVLDPFCGSGTSGVVARNLGRHFVGLDLSFDYLHDQARARLNLDALDAWNSGQGLPVVDAPKPPGALL